MRPSFLLGWVQRGAGLVPTVAARASVASAMEDADAGGSDAVLDEPLDPLAPVQRAAPATLPPSSLAPRLAEPRARSAEAVTGAVPQRRPGSASGSGTDRRVDPAPAAATPREPAAPRDAAIDAGTRILSGRSRAADAIAAPEPAPAQVIVSDPEPSRGARTRRATRSVQSVANEASLPIRPSIAPAPSVVDAASEPVTALSPRSPLVERAWPAAPSPADRAIDVRIGRIEIVQAAPEPPRPAAPPRQPRGFDDQRAARRYMDRRWY